ncbi:MAG: nitroreductase/quinone reductase family protein [Halobacteriales archaeon]
MSDDSQTDAAPPIEPVTPPLPGWVFERLVNPLVAGLLRSPLHGLASDALMLVTYTGRQSGRTYTTPVGYEAVDGTLYVTSQTDRVWWRNLRGGADVTVRLRGEVREGHAAVIEDDAAVADYVRGFIDRHGLDALGRIALSVDAETVPDRDALEAGLDEVVVVEIELADGPD